MSEDLDQVGAWVTRSGLSGLSEPDLLQGFCKRIRAAGVPVTRAHVVVDTLHPVHEGRVFRWRSDAAGQSEMVEYGRTTGGGEMADSWRRSPFYGMLQTSRPVLRKRLNSTEKPEYALFEELRAEGQSDYLALIQHFNEDATIGEMDCIYSSWTTDCPSGFTEVELALLQQLVPSLALAIKAASLARIAETLVQTYLGRDAGRRVLAGKIQRGVAERIEAVLWFSDLRGFTAITDNASPKQIIPFLNDYADAIISAIHDCGGDVLKLIGDGTLAIFTGNDPAESCRAALAAESIARTRIREMNGKRAEADLPVTQAYLGLHIGEVFFGNVGSSDRLDFTVVGPAVNEVSRIATMCRSAERDVLISAAFRESMPDGDRRKLVSVGRYALRGVSRAQELFTLEPEVRKRGRRRGPAESAEPR